jgi:hypothetical protein
LICDWNTAIIEPNSDVTQPIEQIVMDWIINQNWTIKNRPAVTIVAEWSKALTGVGAAIASAIQPENGRLVDLVKAAKIIEELKLTIGLFKYSRTK